MTRLSMFGNIALIALMGAGTGCDKPMLNCEDVGNLDCDHQGRGPAGQNGATGATGATGAAGPAGANGVDGTNGTNGTNGANGENGTNGVDGRDGADGAPGADGLSCTVADNGDGSATIWCEDGSSATVWNGADGLNGTSCTVYDNGDGTSTIECEDGSSVVLGNGTAPECDVGETFPTYCGQGVCRRNGTVTCVGGRLVTDCNAGLPTGDDTDCNGLDNDCDGAVDEDYNAHPTTCGVGQCANSGTMTCSGGEMNSCVPRAGSVEVFNGLDDDCDGAVDNGFTCTLGATMACGATTNAGQCNIGTQTCVASGGGGSTWSACQGSVGPSGETCDGLDNDCDGAVDNGFNVGTACSNGALGACLRTGTYQCNTARNGTVCNAPTPAPGTEVCGNGVDEDCNGSDPLCAPQPTLDIAVVDSGSTAVSLQTDVGLGPTYTWETYEDRTQPYNWNRAISAAGAPHLFRMNFFRTPAGNWICYSSGGVPTCTSYPTLGIAGVPIPVSTYLASRTFIAPNTAALFCDFRYASCAVANIGYCQSGTAFGCEIACGNGLDDDGDGFTDSADPNCN